MRDRNLSWPGFSAGGFVPYVENQMRLTARVVVLSLLVAGTAPLRAQNVVPPTTSDSVPAVTDSVRRTPDISENQTARQQISLGASMTGLRAGVHARETGRPDQPNIVAPQHANLGQARAMMVVGVAALIAGAIIGDTPGTIVMVGGAVIGLIGLYDYLQ
jgi:hypothetical protein